MGKNWLDGRNRGPGSSMQEASNYQVSEETLLDWSKQDKVDKMKAEQESLQLEKDAEKISNPVRVLPEWRAAFTAHAFGPRK